MTVSSLPTMAVDDIQQKLRSGNRPSRVQRALDGIERVGNRLPDPALLFVYFLLATLLLSALLANVAFGVLDPRTDAPLVVRNLLSGSSLTAFLAT